MALVIAVTAAASGLVVPKPVLAAASLVQSKTGTGGDVASFGLTLDATPTSGNLLVAVIGTRGCSGIDISAPTGITGWTEVNADGANTNPCMHISMFYKTATGLESTSVTINASGSGAGKSTRAAIYEYAGGTFTLQGSSTTFEGTTSTTVSSNAITTTSADELIIAAVIAGDDATSGNSFSGWTNSFTEQHDLVNAAPTTSNVATLAIANRLTNSIGSNSTAATYAGSPTNTLGKLVAFTVTDSTAPAGPTSLTSTSHTASTWSSDDTIDMSWVAATDGGSGLDGYSYLFDTTTNTTPDMTKEAEEGATTFTSSALANGNAHYFHIRARDNAGNWGTAVHAGPFFVDDSAPTGPTSVASSSHTVSVASGDDTIDMGWVTATDADSGLDGYSYLFDTSASTDPDGTKEAEEGATTVTSGALGDGASHYFHIRAIDNAGNLGTTVHVGPFEIDTSGDITPPVGPTDVVSTSHTVSTWSGDDEVTMTWTAATDAESGLDGYSYEFDTNATTTPDMVQDLDDTAVTVTSSALANGNAHYFHIRAVDVDGNWGSTVHVGPFFVDVTNPGDVGSLASTSHVISTWSSDVSLDFSWTVASDADSGVDGYSYDLDWSPSTEINTVKVAEEGATSTTIGFLGPTDSGWFHIRTLDNAGNWSDTIHLGPFFVDDVPPGLATSVASNSHTVSTWSNDATIGMTWTDATDADAGLDGYSYVFDTSASTDPDGTKDIEEGVMTVTSGTLSSGNAHWFHIRAIDNAGNLGATVHVGPFFTDALAPTVPGTPSATSPTEDSTPVWSWTASTDAHSGLATTPYAVQWSQDNTFVSGVSTGSSTVASFGHSLVLADGTWYLRAKAADVVGNESAYSAAGSVVIDTVSQAPTSVTPVPTPTNDNTPNFTFSLSEAGTYASAGPCTFTGGTVGAGDVTITFDALADATYSTCYVSFQDTLDNPAATLLIPSFTVDATAPQTTIDTEPSAYITDNTPSFTFSANETATFECKVDAGSFASCTSPYTAATLGEGPHTFEVRAIDTATNVDASPDTSSFTVDTIFPNTSLGSTPPSFTNDATADFTFTADETATFECRFTTGSFAACTSPYASGTLTDDSYTFEVRATDLAGQTDASPAQFTFTVDTVAPDTLFTSEPDALINVDSSTFEFVANETATFECKLDAGSFAVCTSPVNLTGLGEGSHTFEVRAIDQATNVDGTPASLTWVVDTIEPVLDETVAVKPITSDRTPKFTFSSTEAGTIAYGGSCESSTVLAVNGSNEITFNSLSMGVHSDCTITVEDGAGNVSDTLALTQFRIVSGGSAPVAPSIVLMAPGISETMTGGSSFTIMWTHAGSDLAGTRLSYSLNGGSTWTVFAPSVSGLTTSWIVPNFPTTNALIRAEALVGDGDIGANSTSAEFTIVAGTSETDPDYSAAAAMNGAPSINADQGIENVPAPENPGCVSGSLIKLPTDNNPLTTADSAVYYCGQDGKRYAFPSHGVFMSWYADFSSVVEVSPEVLQNIMIGGNVRYRPGVRMIKLQTMNETYAIAPGGILRWVTTEALAVQLYGSDWNTKIDDVSDAFFTDYSVGEPIF